LIIGIDTGGTFTDFFWLDPAGEGNLRVLKEPSTPGEPSRAILNGLGRIEQRFETIVHGTTVATNAVLERKGARVTLLTTRGFEDLIEIGRQTRRDIYDLNVDRPDPLVSRARRIGIRERLDKRGEILEPLEITEEQVSTLKEQNPESVAVCYLFSYINPEHEKKTRELLSEAGLETYWSLSSEVIPEYREYERFSTTVINAHVTPVMDRYLGNLEQHLEADHLRVMQSNGGSMEAGTARRQAVQTLLSGPAGGVVAAQTVAQQCGLENVISFDMGGTSTDVSFLPGRITTTDEATIDDLPVKLPMINIHTVGAGGGSIAFRDQASVLQVGPESAGADPGPVCYDQGGSRLTVTDANLLTGRLVESAIFGDAIRLNKEKTAHQADQFSREFGIGREELAESILAVANARMERAIRVISVEQGYDPGTATLIAFGGAGPLHGCAIAEALGIGQVLVPMHAGVFSAFGLLWADVVRDRTRTVIRRTPDIDWEELEGLLLEIQAEVERDILAQGIAAEAVRFEWILDMRYKAQSYELSIPWQPEMIEAFHRRHEERYTFRHDDRPVEVVNLQVRGIGSVAKPDLPAHEGTQQEISLEHHPKQTGYYQGARITTPVIERSELVPGATGEGPFVVAEQTSTTFVPPDWQLRVNEYGHLMLRQGR